MLGDTDQMERLVRDLLFLARTTGDPAPHQRSLLDLDDVTLEEAARVRTRSDVRVDTSRVSAAPVRGDSDELRRLVRNLLENAVRHATSVVQLELRGVDGVAVLDVTDDGPGIAAEDRDRVFDRFFTADGARAPRLRQRARAGHRPLGGGAARRHARPGRQQRDRRALPADPPDDRA